ncbi:TPA: IS21 family transposase [Enterococcus faecium]|nr:IS21 family transposase ISMac9 [Enterococcus faecium]BDP58942.1 IS21 family transposase ISMac9 [Enterococcus faecium]BDP62377.1 IS21 family transposase ISMac9 [Enterococcus faecium]HCR4501655.1 IS21 family transposase [Enterococcus faecium]
MRKDIYEGVLLNIMNETKPNYAALAKQFNCDYRTVKRYYEAGISKKLPDLGKRNQNKKTLIDDYTEIIADKLSLGCSSTAIYHFIKRKGYKGSERTVRRYCRNIREDKVEKATVRIETTPGLSAQVDWKEEVKLALKSGEIITCNIFLYVLGYSRMKYLEVTFDRSQKTLFSCLTQAFQETGGVPQEIWFDNMKTVVNRSKSQFTKVVFNETFRQYSKDAGFKPIACRPFRPQTKGKVEALARTMERLKVYNYELDDKFEFCSEATILMDQLNYEEISQATYERPVDRWSIEKPKLKEVDLDQLLSYSVDEKMAMRKVSIESMVQYKQRKYSVPIHYIGQNVLLEEDDGYLNIYHNGDLIREHVRSEKLLNYEREDYIKILQSDVFKNLKDEELEHFVDENLKAYDEL